MLVIGYIVDGHHKKQAVCSDMAQTIITVYSQTVSMSLTQLHNTTSSYINYICMQAVIIG